MAETTDEIKFEPQGIGAALATHRFIVPMNQRDYAWEDEHVTDLLHDLSAAMDITPPVYFLGTIVLTKGHGDYPEVSDGQQRLATTTIILAAIRDYLLEIGEETRARSIEQPYLTVIDYTTQENVPKIQLNVDDNMFFVRRIIDRPTERQAKPIKPTRESHQKIEKAAELAAQHIRNFAENYRSTDRATKLGRWVSFLQTGAQVIILTVPNHLNAFVMFETLNDRGLRASEADLIKNFLLQQAGDRRIKEARHLWAKMLGVLESIAEPDEEDITVTYIRHVLISLYGPTKGREVYQRVEKNFGGTEKAVGFVHTLAERSNIYAALFNPQHSKWNDYDETTRLALETMLELGVKQVRPLMFSIASKFSPNEASKAFRLLVAWSVRFLIVGGRGGLLDRNYATIAQEVGTGAITTAKQLTKSSAAEMIPSDTVFAAAFAEARVSQSSLARYYLRSLENTEEPIARPELTPRKDSKIVNLEHVIPENPEDKWPGIDADTAAAHFRRIGNMVLLHAPRNAEIGNAPFSEKRKAYKASSLALTSKIAAKTTWTIKDINERQKALAELAVKTWPITV